MPQTSSNPIDWLLNRTSDGAQDSGQVVEAPAFSSTKVLTSAAVIITPLVTILLNTMQGDNFSFTPAECVTLTLGVLAFVAVLGSADVLARAWATAAALRAKAIEGAEQAAAAELKERLALEVAQQKGWAIDKGQTLFLSVPVPVTVPKAGADAAGSMLAVKHDGKDFEYLVQVDGAAPTWQHKITV
jgi:hypothetical protein